MLEHRIKITGIGVMTPIAQTPDEFWRKLIEGAERVHLSDSAARPSTPAETFRVYCEKAIRACIQDAGLDCGKKGCILVGTGMGIADTAMLAENPPATLLSSIEEVVKQAAPYKVEVRDIANACCAGAQAIAYATDLLRMNQYDYVIAGGIEIFSYLTYCGFARLFALDKEGCRPFDRNRKGISVGEGAAFFALEKGATQKDYGSILGYATTHDAYHVTAPDPTGQYARTAIEKLLSRLRLQPRDIQGIIAHGTGTKSNDQVEAKVLYEIFKDQPGVTAPKCVFGHTGGASGAFSLLTAILALQHQCLPPIHHHKVADPQIHVQLVTKRAKDQAMERVLVNCFAFGGTNIAMICEKRPSREGRGKPYIRRHTSVSSDRFQGEFFTRFGGRLMDDLTKKVLLTMDDLFNSDYGCIKGDRTGLVLSSNKGPYTAICQTADIVRRWGYKRINPSAFPYTMFSTALAQAAMHVNIHGPACCFLDSSQRGYHAVEYSFVQIENGHCDAMIEVYVDADGWTEGSYITI